MLDVRPCRAVYFKHIRDEMRLRFGEIPQHDSRDLVVAKLLLSCGTADDLPHVILLCEGISLYMVFAGADCLIGTCGTCTYHGSIVFYVPDNTVILATCWLRGSI